MENFNEIIQGPVFPILTLFDSTGNIDKSGLEKYVDFLISNGAKTLMCTIGTSRYDVLTTDEIFEVNQIVVESARKRAITIVTTPSFGPTSQAIEYARHAQNIQADLILALYPDRYYGDQCIYEFFKSISDNCEIPVMIHEMPMRAGRVQDAPSWQYTIPLLDDILSIDNVVGMKEESADTSLIREINTKYSIDYVVIGGRGGMSAHLDARVYGQKTYLVGIGNVQPNIEIDFVNALESGNKSRAEEIISKYEKPFFEVATRIGWHPVLKEAMHLTGLCSPHERKPMLRISEDDRIMIKNTMKNIGIL